MLSDEEIARAASPLPVFELADQLGIPASALLPYGHDQGKISADLISSIQDKPDGQLVLVTAMSPTPMGEGKTTVAIGLNDALCKLGHQSIVCLREPSMGPCFGLKVQIDFVHGDNLGMPAARSAALHTKVRTQ